MTKFIHDNTNLHNLNSPNAIVPEILKLVKPKSVVDVGCGLGAFLYVFKQYGVKEVLGINGPWVEKEILFSYIDSKEFLEWNLEKELVLDKKFDLVVSLEVAEHLSENSAETFVKTLVNAGNIILFSAAIPGQDGQNHINEQWLTYWEKLFLKHDYIIHDVIRPIIWDNPKIKRWHKQNMVFITPKEFKFQSELTYCPMRNIVHYELFNYKSQLLKKIFSGKANKIIYLYLFATLIIGERTAKKIKLMLKKIKRH